MISRTHITCCAVIILLGQAFLSQPVQAQQDDAKALIAIIDAVEKGWESISWISTVLVTSSQAGKTTASQT